MATSNKNTPLEVQWELVRATRNSLLTACDWTQLLDSKVDADEWATYRQELRDVTNQDDPYNIVYPTQP